MTVECWHCQRLFDPVAARWRCTTCGAKAACCEGAPAEAGNREFLSVVV
jgi:hypothetical protein